MSRRVGILGGTFDPIHTGHIDLGIVAQTLLTLTRVYVLPARVPPHRPQPMASSYHRFAMVALAVASRRGWRASDLELESPDQRSYTTMTLQKLHEQGFAPSELFFIIGADAFAEIETWRDYPNILDRSHFAVVSRPGCSVEDLPRLLPGLRRRMIRPPVGAIDERDPAIILIDERTADVSSTAIRERRAAGESIGGLVDLGVEQHIEQHGLYIPNIPGRRDSDDSDTPAGRLHGES
ncbi:MAG TPA: nicotinate-nucleotide adenylyltransferase [Vicinamibacterales bacterium]|jgi:nicotinate-nucleotide adenylyltransferase